ncbi:MULTISPECIES: DUF3007 family protein [Prochlorococcus]|uniref:DUF3007 family protein n=1 Tax=Prochlorococcus TaxID=1218 RepID=UPI0005337361|nr:MULTISPECIES: DUF3007 family protein [Prochlorococcus]KGG12815.1 hypothetical protein EV05_0487 [Prochlorococcus sp. MIT 0601]
MTRANVIQLGFLVFALGATAYVSLLAFGIDGFNAGLFSETLLLILLVGWISSYFFRVFQGKMTFMEQRKRYREAYEQLANREVQEKFDSMSEEEQKKLINQLEIDNN